MSISLFNEASHAQTALSDAIRGGDAQAIVAASQRFSNIITAAGNPTTATDTRPVAALRSEIVASHQMLNLLRDAAARRSACIADLRGDRRVATYGQRPAA